MELTSYEPLHVPLPKMAVTDAQLDERIASIVAQIPTYANQTDALVELHDKVNALVTMRENGEPMPGLEEASLTITVGDGFFPQEFAQGLVGMKCGETKTFEYQQAGIGTESEDDLSSTIEATVTIESIRKRVDPELNDEWVKRFVPRFSTVEEFRADVEARLVEEMDKKREELLRERCSVLLAQRLKEKPTDEEVESAAINVRASFERDCMKEGKDRAQKASEMGIPEEQLEAFFHQAGTMAVAQGKAIAAMADYWNIQPTDKDLDETLQKHFGNDKQAKARFDTEEGREKLIEMARCELALDAVITDAIVFEQEEPTNDVPPQVAARQALNPFA
ncbi:MULTISPECIES: hypothetical protein [Gordonibacter]|uniref:Peptidylprolyl isomerase n=1 Tax=Gordonibacter faecis TaxID=3047475 RepID=A0ABT7DII7_9ACTN|nr:MULTISPECIES: hypothetical protein [unclassified Gordonibacter]MDJ1649334.1 hypothetical protein [Gordonibacter sp. KGMB12511]HIW75200.1 hypothetical protein [Candidatus Gordonibacter avicola]